MTEPSDYGKDISGYRRVDFTLQARTSGLARGRRPFRVSEDHPDCCHNPAGRHFEDEPDTCCHSHVLETRTGLTESSFEEIRGWTNQITDNPE